MTQYVPAIITLLSLMLFAYTIIAVGLARTKYQIKAPATTGNDNFERVFRVQMNTQESLILFLPALWLFSLYVSSLWAGIIGVVWLLGRLYYALSYTRSAAARSPGFALGFLAFLVLAVGASIGIVMQVITAM